MDNGLFWMVLAVQTVAFAVWAYVAFSVLFHLRGRGEAMTGQPWNGPVVFLRAAGEWLRDPAEQRRRRLLFVLTLVLCALSVAQAVVGPNTAG